MKILITGHTTPEREIIKYTFQSFYPATVLLFDAHISEAEDRLLKGSVQLGWDRPDLILLCISDHDTSSQIALLKAIKESTVGALKRIPVIILAPEGVAHMPFYKSHANSFFERPNSSDEFIELLKVIGGFWCRDIVQLPPKTEHH